MLRYILNTFNHLSHEYIRLIIKHNIHLVKKLILYCEKMGLSTQHFRQVFLQIKLMHILENIKNVSITHVIFICIIFYFQNWWYSIIAFISSASFAGCNTFQASLSTGAQICATNIPRRSLAFASDDWQEIFWCNFFVCHYW